MSIFKESFRDYIKQQFNIRQKVIASGNFDKDSPSRLYHGFDNLAPGAFYAYQQKQCIIRMSSLVDLMTDVGFDLGVTQPDGTRYSTPFNSYKGSTFARNYVLEGGVLSDYARNISETEDGTEVKVRKFDVRGGFPKPGKRVNLSYGDPSLAADPSEDGYGVVPMPGITDANVRTKSAYGSLREAKINFVCHNLRQLEILELLYMRPGYPVLVEWGWSPHISNNGEIINDFPSVANYEEFWNDNLISQEFIQNEIIRLKKEFNGNYDGFVGFVTNFNYEARSDGGFNCSTELISMGEVISSLKVPSISFSSIDEAAYGNLNEEEKRALAYKNSLGQVIQDLNNIINAVDLKAEADKAIIEASGYYGASGGGADFRTGQVDRALKDRTALEKKIETTRKKITDVLGPEVAAQSLIEKGKFLTDSNETTIQTTEGYIRWDAFADLLNFYVIPKNEKGSPPLILSTNRVFINNKNQTEIEPLLYAKYTNPNESILDVSCSPKICILPHQFETFEDDELNLTKNEKVSLAFTGLGLTLNPITFPLGIAALGKVFNAETIGNIDKSEFESLSVNSELSKRRIGGIFLSINNIRKIFEETFTNNPNTTIGEFLKKIWNSVNKVCPMHNFVIRTDNEHTHIVQVIDLPITSEDLEEINYDNLFKFNVLSNDTIIRQFKYNTQIPSALKATIAINAQAGATSDDLDSVTFAAFNKAIKSRLHSFSEKFSEKEETFYRNIQKTRFEKELRLLDIKDILTEYNSLFFNFIDTGQNNLKNLEAKFGNIHSLIKEAQSIELYLEKSSSGYLKNQAIIPLNLNLSIDGISSLIIGNVFRVDESRLPRAYRDSNIAFVVLGEDQTITAGQDWVTNIRGQLILFPKEEESNKKHQLRKGLRRIEGSGVNQAADAVAEEVEEARKAFAVAESTNNDIDTTEVDQILEDQQAEEELTDLEKLGYTLDIQSNLINNDTFWLAEDINYPGGGNKTYVLQNQIRYEEYNSFDISVARNAGVKVTDYKGFEIFRLPNGYFTHSPDILFEGEVDSYARSDSFGYLSLLKDVIDEADNKIE